MRPRTAGDLVLLRLVEQVEALHAAEAAVRAGHPEGVHDLRVAMRRLRSALATFRPVLEAAVTEPVREELRWDSGELGRVRDAEVVAERVAAHAEATDDATDADGAAGGAAGEAADADALREVAAGLASEVQRGRAAVPAVLDSARHRALVERLDGLVADPPLGGRAGRRARRFARRRVRHELRRFRRRAAEALAETDPDARAGLLHEARKAAKRLRYAAEAVAPVTGGRVRRLGEAAEQVQDLLGSHHDTVATREALRRLAGTDADPRLAFALGRLDALEQAEAQRLDDAAADAVRHVRRSGRRADL